MSELLLTKGYKVFGTSRDAQLAPLSNLVHLGVRDRLQEIEVATGQVHSEAASFAPVRHEG